MQKGVVLEEEEIPLPANGQTAQFINELFTQTGTSDFVGSVRCSAPAGAVVRGSGFGNGLPKPHLHHLAHGAGFTNGDTGFYATVFSPISPTVPPSPLTWYS